MSIYKSNVSVCIYCVYIEYIQYAGFIFDNDRECNIKATCYTYLHKGHYEYIKKKKKLNIL